MYADIGLEPAALVAQCLVPMQQPISLVISTQALKHHKILTALLRNLNLCGRVIPAILG